MKRFAVLLVGVMVLGGCGTSSLTIEGRVIEAPTSFVTTAAKDDERLTAPGGVAGAKVQIRLGKVEQSGPLLVEGVSQADGAFKLVVTRPQLIRDTLFIRAAREGYIPAKGSSYFPSSERRFLILLGRSVEPPKAVEKPRADEQEGAAPAPR